MPNWNKRTKYKRILIPSLFRLETQIRFLPSEIPTTFRDFRSIGFGGIGKDVSGLLDGCDLGLCFTELCHMTLKCPLGETCPWRHAPPAGDEIYVLMEMGDMGHHLLGTIMLTHNRKYSRTGMPKLSPLPGPKDKVPEWSCLPFKNFFPRDINNDLPEFLEFAENFELILDWNKAMDKRRDGH
jgi:hypothetical protein